MYVIYADEVFAENLIVDYILLLATAKLAGIPAKRVRLVLAAALGGLYAAGAAVWGGGPLRVWAVKAAVGLVMVLIVFGASDRLLRVAALFFGVSAAFAGAVMAAALVRGEEDPGRLGRVSFASLILAFAAFYALFSAAFRVVLRRRVRGRVGQLRVEYRGRSARIPALLDTGNGLTSPFSGLPVTVCTPEALEGLFDREVIAVLRTERDTLRALEKLSDLGVHAFFPVPFRAVGVERGMLPAFRPDSVTLCGRRMDCALAVAPSGLGTGCGYSAVTTV